MTTLFPLGRVVEHDPRSLSFPAPDGKVKSKTWRHYGPILDQGDVGSCTGNAAAQAMNTTPNHHHGFLLTEADALDIYHWATVLDGYPGEYPPDDTGSSGLAAAKALKQRQSITRYEHAFGLDHALAALMSGPVMLGTNWFDGMFNPDGKGYVTPDGAVAGGHEYLLVGVNLNGRSVTCLNSWGSSWGLKGKFHMTFDTLDALLSADGDATLPII
jgi:C1A family cysteine protease